MLAFIDSHCSSYGQMLTCTKGEEAEEGYGVGGEPPAEVAGAGLLLLLHCVQLVFRRELQSLLLKCVGVMWSRETSLIRHVGPSSTLARSCTQPCYDFSLSLHTSQLMSQPSYALGRVLPVL